MLNHYFSSSPIAELLEQPRTLAIMPVRGICEYREPGVIDAGIDVFDKTNLNEVWSVENKVKRGIAGKAYWSQSDDLICVAHWLSEGDCEQLEVSTCDAYLSILALLKNKGYTYPFRFWNYLPDINAGNGDDEVYKRFCTGRLKAFESVSLDVSDFPAASALGHHGKGAVIYVLASNYEPQHFKNSKQVNAYEYPREYGVSSPSFARATAVTLEQTPCLFISGTASIIGHETVAIGDLKQQLEVTADNIEYLLATANPHDLALSTLKVYLRHQEHYDQTIQWLAKRYPDIPVAMTYADICRSDLLVEIECFCR